MNPTEFEVAVQRIYQDLLRVEGIVVHHLKDYQRKSSGLPLKIDVSFEIVKAGFSVLVVVECKCYARRVEVGDVDEFFAKMQDIGAHKGVMVTTVGFQAGADMAAEGRGIALALLSDDPQPGEMVYIRKSVGIEKSDILRGNVRPWTGARSPHGVRFDAPRDFVVAIGEGAQ